MAEIAPPDTNKAIASPDQNGQREHGSETEEQAGKILADLHEEGDQQHRARGKGERRRRPPTALEAVQERRHMMTLVVERDAHVDRQYANQDTDDLLFVDGTDTQQAGDQERRRNGRQNDTQRPARQDGAALLLP